MPNNHHSLTTARQTVSTGVVLMTYGSATTAENVAQYMEHVYPNAVPEGLIEDFAERYRLVGGSPLVRITEEQAAALDVELGDDYVVRAGMLHSMPFIDQAVSDLKQAGCQKIVGLILSPQFSSFIMEGYRSVLKKAAEVHGYSADDLTIIGPWPDEPHFVELLVERVRAKQKMLQAKHGLDKPIPTVFTTHSLPERVVAKDPSYLDQLKQTTNAVTAKLNMPGLEWYAAYQSAGHTPEPWLKPDLVDILADLRDEQHKVVLIVPIQFLADHLEILYDLDMAGGEQCEEYGIEYNRIELPGVAAQFIAALAALVKSS